MNGAELWANLMQAHAGLNWAVLLPFYGFLAAAGFFAALMIRMVRKAGRAAHAAERVQGLEQELKQLRGLEEQTHQLRSDTGALQAQLKNGYTTLRDRMDSQKDDLAKEVRGLQAEVQRELEEVERTLSRELEDATTRATRRMEKLEQDGNEVLRQMESNNHRIAEVEKRIPDIYEHLEEFRTTLGNIFQSELSAVLNSFDSSVAAVLDHMKGELEMGINRIEGIESMVHSRQRAERTLLGRGHSGTEADDASQMVRPGDQTTAEKQALLEGLADEEAVAFDEEMAAEDVEDEAIAEFPDLEQEQDPGTVASDAFEGQDACSVETEEGSEEVLSEEEPFEVDLEEDDVLAEDLPEPPEAVVEEEAVGEEGENVPCGEEQPEVPESPEGRADQEEEAKDEEDGDFSAAA